MDSLPWVTPVYKRDLTIEKYFGGYLKHPYISFYTGRGCKSRCTFCLWPQTVGGHRYRVRSVENVVAEMKWAKEAFPQVKEYFFDDDTLTDNLPRVEALARELGKLGVTWSCNAKANVPRKTLEVMKDNGLRLLLVGYESGNQQILFNIKKGMRVEFARRFTKDCHELGIVIHGTFILGLPGETRETIQETLDFAKEINPHTIQISLAAPYPGTFLYRQAKENGWLYNEEVDLLTQEGTQIAPLSYPHLSHTEIFESVEDFYKKFYFRPSKIASIVAEMIAESRDDEAPIARGCGVLPLLADPPGRCVKRLIVTADDFGAAREVNEAVEAAHRGGILTAASLMVAAPAADDAVARARRMPSLRVGLHVVLVEGTPVLPASAVPHLVDDSGDFRSNMAALGAAHRGQPSGAPRARRRNRRAVRGLSRDRPRARSLQRTQAFPAPSGDRRHDCRDRRSLRAARRTSAVRTAASAATGRAGNSMGTVPPHGSSCAARCGGDFAQPVCSRPIASSDFVGRDI